MELKLSRKVRIRRFCVHIGGRKGKDSVNPLLSGFRVLVTSYREKDVIHSSHFTRETCPQASWISEHPIRVCQYPQEKELGILSPDRGRSITTHQGHPSLLKELADVTEELISIPFVRFWQWGKIPNAWQKAGVALTQKRVRMIQGICSWPS